MSRGKGQDTRYRSYSRHQSRLMRLELQGAYNTILSEVRSGYMADLLLRPAQAVYYAPLGSQLRERWTAAMLEYVHNQPGYTQMLNDAIMSAMSNPDAETMRLVNRAL